MEVLATCSDELLRLDVAACRDEEATLLRLDATRRKSGRSPSGLGGGGDGVGSDGGARPAKSSA